MSDYNACAIGFFQIIRYFMFVDEFPMNAAGKILKYKMRDISAEKLGLKK